MTDNGFFTEIRHQFDLDIDLKYKLDTKASSMITASGAITALLSGFGALVLKDMLTTNTFFVPALVLLLVQVGFTISSLCAAIGAYRLQEYTYPLVYSHLRKDGKLTDKYREYKKMNEQEFDNLMIQSYLKSLEENKPLNDGKGRKVNVSQRLLIIALALVPILVFVVALSRF
jgi:hypothetical protein